MNIVWVEEPRRTQTNVNGWEAVVWPKQGLAGRTFWNYIVRKMSEDNLSHHYPWTGSSQTKQSAMLMAEAALAHQITKTP